MPQLTEAELEKLSTDELRALAMKEVVEEPEKEEPKKAPEPEPEEQEETEEEEEKHIYRKEIDNGNGVIEVFEADSVDELIDKIAEGKRNASLKIRELSEKIKVEDTRTAQQKADDEYVIAERLKKEPSKAIREIISEVIEERIAKQVQWDKDQSRFVQTHPDFIANADNGKRLTDEVQRLGLTPDYASLEKAYQTLKASGLLLLKAEGSEEATETETKESERIAQPKAEVTQPRSPKRGSNLSTRTAVAPKPDTAPSEDEAYELPLDKLRELANRQLAERNNA